MPFFAVAGSVMTCSFGVAPCALITPPLPGKPTVNGMPVALINDVLVANIPTFGMCSSPANPQVAAATAAAMGVLTPMPCVPVVVAPWAPPALAAFFSGTPLATQSSTCVCAFGGAITFTAVPQFLAEG